MLTPSRSSDPLCDARMTLKRSLATDLADDATVVLATAVFPANIVPILPKNDILLIAVVGISCIMVVIFGPGRGLCVDALSSLIVHN
jgi:hypothetical protein